MTKKDATKEAKIVAKRDRIKMVVTFDPYGEDPDKAQNFNYFPHRAAGIFKYEEVIDTIEPGDG